METASATLIRQAPLLLVQLPLLFVQLALPISQLPPLVLALPLHVDVTTATVFPSTPIAAATCAVLIAPGALTIRVLTLASAFEAAVRITSLLRLLQILKDLTQWSVDLLRLSRNAPQAGQTDYGKYLQRRGETGHLGFLLYRSSPTSQGGATLQA